MTGKNPNVRWGCKRKGLDGVTHSLLIIAEKTEKGWFFYERDAFWYNWRLAESTPELIETAEYLLATGQGLAFPNDSLDSISGLSDIRKRIL